MWEILSARYEREMFVRVEDLTDAGEADELSFDPQALNHTNVISLRVLPHQSGHILLMARLDNLGKGAAGVAIQNLNLMLGVSEETGLPGYTLLAESLVRPLRSPRIRHDAYNRRRHAQQRTDPLGR